MNIALIGAPGSGKTRLARQLAKRLPGQVSVVDNYVAKVERRTNMALGPLADYLGNLYVALERYADERNARARNATVVSCGTIIETAVYMAMHFQALSLTLTEEDKLEAAPRMDAVLRMLAVLYNDICTYDHGFYLPPAEGSDADAMYMDRHLQAGLGGFKLIPVVPLGNVATRLDEALAALEGHEVHAA